MKILYLMQNVGGTGSGTYSHLLTEAMAKRHEIALRTYEQEVTGDWDLVHALDMKHFTPKILSQISAPLILDIHDYYWTRFYPFFCPDFPLRFIFQKIRKPKYLKIIEKSHAVVVHSKFMLSQIHHPRKFFVRLGIDFEKYNPQRVIGNSPRILFAGRDYFRKGIFPLLQAIEIVQRKFPNVRLLVAGKEYPHSLGFSKILSRNLNVEFLGGFPHEKLVQLFPTCDVFVLPSHIEAFGIVFLEAMASKVPVVGAAVGGIPEIIEDGKTGFLVPPNNPKELARALIRCLNRDKKIDKMVENAYKFVGENFTVEKMIEDLERVYF